MARPLLLQDDFSAGMKPDIPIMQLPKNAVRNMTDLLPMAGEAPLSARNGWDRVGGLMPGSYAAAVSFAPFINGGQLVGIDNTGAVFVVPHTSDAANTARGTAQVPLQSPVFYRNVLYIPSDNGSTSVKSYGGSSNVAAASGSPPAGMLAVTFKDHLVLARDGANPRRVWFSNGGDAGVWDTAADGQWLDTTHAITGLAVVRNMILAFAEEGCERIRGDIIPGVSGSDMVVEPIPIPGTADPGSIVVASDVCYYANATGIYMTDGIGSVDLTLQGDIKNWWNNLLSGYDAAWTLAAGMFSGKYIVVAHDGSTFKLCLVCDVARRAFYQFTNVPATMFGSVPEGYASSTAGALFMAERDAPYLVKASTMFNRRSLADDVIGGDYADGNGGDREVRLRTKYFLGDPGRKRFKKLYATLGASAAVTVDYHAYLSPTIISGSEVTAGTISGAFSPTTLPTRKKVSLNRAVEGVSLELHADMTTITTLNIYKLEAEILPSEPSRG
jgi:hypothetical protein